MLTTGKRWCIMFCFFSHLPLFAEFDLFFISNYACLSLSFPLSLLGQSDSDGDTIVSPTFAREPSDDAVASVYTDKPVITSKYYHGLSCSNGTVNK